MPLLFSSKVSLTALYLPSPSLYHPIAPINLTNIRSSRTLPPTPTVESSLTRVAGEYVFDAHI
jgi:hypothetical protein